MALFFNILMLVLIPAILTLHVLSLLFDKSAALNLSALFAHILALIPLIYFSATLEVVLALYMLSLAIRCALFIVLSRILSRHSKDKEVQP